MKGINIMYKNNNNRAKYQTDLFKRAILSVALFFVLITNFLGSHLQAETVTYYITDLTGSPIAAMDEAGGLKWRESTNPYGETRINPTANKDDVGFTGHQQDDATNLVYMQARYYDPVIGRFYGIDPVGFGNVHNFNRYAYANNNPYRFVDPDGQDPGELRRQISRANRGEFKHQIKIDAVDKAMSAVKMSSFIPAAIGGPVLFSVALTQSYDGYMELTSEPGTTTPIIQQSLESANVNSELAAAANGVVSLAGGVNALKGGYKKLFEIFIGSNNGSLTVTLSSLAIDTASLMYGLEDDFNSITDLVTNKEEDEEVKE